MDTNYTQWLAGLFEGEGCISFTGVNSVCLTVNSTDQDIIDRIKNVTECGFVYGPITPTYKNAKPQFSWKVSKAADVRAVLEAILPYLGNRRTLRANDALERLKSIPKEGYCRKGHAMSGDNLYQSPGGQRHCRACAKVRESQRKRIKH